MNLRNTMIAVLGLVLVTTVGCGPAGGGGPFGWDPIFEGTDSYGNTAYDDYGTGGDIDWSEYCTFGHCPSSPKMASFAGSENGAVVRDADDHKVAFTRSAPHTLIANGQLASDVTATADGRLFHGERAFGSVSYVESANGERITTLVSLRGKLLDLDIEDGVLVIRETAIDVPMGATRAVFGDAEGEAGADLGLVPTDEAASEQVVGGGATRLEID